MHMLKECIVSGTECTAHHSQRDSRPPGAQLETTTWGTAGDIQAIVFQGQTDHLPPTWGTAN